MLPGALRHAARRGRRGGDGACCWWRRVRLVGGGADLKFINFVVDTQDEACLNVYTVSTPSKFFCLPMKPAARTHTHFIIPRSYTSATAKGKVTHMQR